MSDRIRVATRKGLFTVRRSGAGQWRIDGAPAFLGDPVSMVLDDARDGSLYAALNLGHFGCKLKRSTDDGRSWQEAEPPAYPPQPEGAEGPPWKLELIWSLEAGGRDEPGVLWAGTIPGGLFRSADHGASWQLVQGLWQRPERLQWGGGGYDHPGLHSIVVDPRDARRLTLAISTGGIWQSADGGASWTQLGQGLRACYMLPEQQHDLNAQDVHRIDACAARPERVWLQHHCGMYRSDDGGASWQELAGVQPSVFGFAVAAHPRDPDTAWFVPAVKDEQRVPVGGRLVVTRTRDGGRSFEALGEGLPQQDCYDLVYRHGLAVDASGERLAIGSTTGGLWVSEDAGASWSCAAAHLPPIAALRFAPS
jgi:photosystem II stability/assembly factor-like uncharacterized protein